MKRILFIIILSFLSVNIFLKAQSVTDLNSQIQLNPDVKTGKLENGMTYYVMQNKKPERRVELRLAVNVGSTQENDDQLGLAHLTEHMAFNGTKNFKKNELIEYLESIGASFGADLNAYTSYDETVYMIKIPTDSAEVIDKAFQILEDWAHNVTEDSIEIDKERGVVIEEWRLGLGADKRMRSQYEPLLYRDSRYAVRDVIGTKEILQNSTYETLRSFYRDWYRPDLMAVIVVGDIDVDKTVDRIKKQFGSIPRNENPRPLQSFQIPDNTELVIAKATDKEATSTNIEIIYKHPKEITKTLGDYKKALIVNLYTLMLNRRLNELTQSPEQPFTYAENYYGPLTRTKDAFILYAGVNNGGIEKGMEALFIENQRAIKFGFTQTEMERAKKEFLRYEEIQYNERDKTESQKFIDRLIYNYLSQDPYPGISFEYDFYKEQLPGITLEDLNDFTRERANEKNPVVIITAPDKAGASIPSDDKIKSILEDAKAKDIAAYKDVVTDKSLLTTIPVAGKVLSEEQTPEVGITTWKLSNGATVILKPTDFKNDEIQFNSFCFGGSSLYSENDYLNAALCADIINNGGLGDFNLIELQKFLSGKVANISPDIDDITQGMSGNCSPQDAETMFQMIYLYFTNPNKNKTDFDACISKYRGYLENRSSDPNAALRDTVTATMGQYNYRKLPMTEERLKQVDFDRVYEIYKERFSDPAGFTFMFVGNFKPETFKPLIEEYIGGIPSGNKKETYKDLGIRAPKGFIHKIIKKGIEPKSRVNIVLTGPFVFSRNNTRGLTVLMNLMNIKLIEKMREEKSEVYGAGGSADYSLFPKETYKINFGWGCAPENVDGLIKTLWEEIDKIKSNGCDAKDLVKIKEEGLRKYEINMKDNAYWLNMITGRAFENKNILDILDYPKFINSLTSDDFKNLANQYLNKKM